MLHPLFRLSSFATLILVLNASQTVMAVQSGDQLMPATTTGFLSIPNVERLQDDFDKTQLGQLMADPVMKPFADDLRRQIKDKVSKRYETLGLTWSDLESVPTGEVCLATIRPAPNKAAMAVVADVTENLDGANELLQKVHTKMTSKGAQFKEEEQDGVTLKIYTRKDREDGRLRVSVIYINEAHNQLVAADDLDVARDILARFDGGAEDNMAGVKAYQVIAERCTKAQEDLEPHIRWFVEPFGYVETLRIANPPNTKSKKQDMLKVLKNQGFTAVLGVGGLATLADGANDILHRTMIYAPAVERAAGDKSKDKYNLAMRMLSFPNKGGHDPPTWIPRELASYGSLQADLKSGFEHSKSLVNELADDEIFEDVLDSLKNDPSGPRVDVRKEVVANVGDHIMILTDNQLPITPESERLMFCVELTNVAPVKIAVDKTMENDPNAKRRVIGDHIIWEIVEEETELPEFEFEFGFDEIEVPEDDEANENRALPNAAVTVAHGHLLIATHVDFIVKVLEEAERRETLVGSADYQIVQTALQQLGADSEAARTFSRTDEEFRGTYELLKQGKMPQSKSMMGRMLNMVLDDGDDETVREQELDGSKMPDFQIVRRYLGPAGMYVTSLDDGWMVIGTFLSSETLQVVLKTE